MKICEEGPFIPINREILSTPIDRAPAFKEIESMTTGLLSRGLRWIQARNLARKSTSRLQVRATVALGEKRFVSVIECDGFQFLIGGGATNVSLLAQLSPSLVPNTSNSDAVQSERAR
jgi:hypothetical protein